MILPSKGKYLCEVLPRIKKLSSGLYLTDRLKEEKKDNVARCLGVGDQTIRTCYLCHENKRCRTRCREKGKPLPILAKRTDIIHFKSAFSQKFTYEGRKLVVLTHDDIIAIEDDSGNVKAVGSMVVIKKIYSEKMGTIYVPDNAKQNSGDFWGEVISSGPLFSDKSCKKGDKVIYLRGEGYRFRPYNGDSRMELYAVKSCWVYGMEN